MSEKFKDKFYEVAVMGKKITNCSCQGWQVHKVCKHANKIRYEKLTLTPRQKQIQTAQAQKYGRQVAHVVSENPAYRSVQERVNSDQGLKEFMEATS
jgi:hypothetical protein